MIEEDRQPLASLRPEIGFGCIISEEEAFGITGRRDVPNGMVPTREIVIGEEVRDWSARSRGAILFPYNADICLTVNAGTERALWPWKVLLLARRDFGNRTYREVGRSFAEYHQIPVERNRIPLTIAFGEVASHNHFVLDRGGKVFNRTAPIIKLPVGFSEGEHLGLLGLLNSSTACFWLKARCKDKGGDQVGSQGARIQNTTWDERYAFNATNVGQFPLVAELPLELARGVDAEAQHLSANLPTALCDHAPPTRDALNAARAEAEAARARMIALQEELDWRCYRLYGLHEAPPEHPHPPPLQLGERAFEIVMARQMADGELETAWFERHRSTPITEIPAHWPTDYHEVVERRIALIESNPQISLIERPEYKRRWSMPSWEEMEQEALRNWLLDRLEDRRFWPGDDPRLISTRQLADDARRDAEFVSVAELYAGSGCDIETLVAKLASREAVPFLSAFRYSEAGLRKRAQWEDTWEKQRREDAIDAEVTARRDEFLLTEATRLYPRQEGETAEAWFARLASMTTTSEVQARAARTVEQEQRQRKTAEVADIPVPPKYNKNDFLTAECWRLRGGLDVPKERFVLFPRCERDADGSPVVTWAGYDHLARSRAIAAYYLDRKNTDGWDPERLKPILAGIVELLPWLRQWHNAYNPAAGLGMGDFFSDFVRDEARGLGTTAADLVAWAPPAAPRRSRGRRRLEPAAEPVDLTVLEDLL